MLLLTIAVRAHPKLCIRMICVYTEHELYYIIIMMIQVYKKNEKRRKVDF